VTARRKPGRALTLALCAVLSAAAVTGASQAADRSAIAERVMTLTRGSLWKLASTVPIAFRTFHPQGMVRIGDTFLVSSVDKDGRAGHLFKIDAGGRLLGDLSLGEGDIYHPGGIDYDGRYLWVPVAEYRPDSRSIVYRVDPTTMKAVEVFRFADHIGAIVHNTDEDTLHGVSWGSRRFYRWPLGKDGRITNAATAPEALRTLNPSHYVDYQDCKYVGGRRMLCTGVTEIRQSLTAVPFRLGGMDLVNLADGRPLHQVPVLLWTPGGFDMTHNPVWVEARVTGLRAYFIPEDDKSTIYVYDVEAR
jgi:hypothetical protein